MEYITIGLNTRIQPGLRMEMGKATIDIDNQQSRYNVCLKTIREVSRKALGALGCPDSELSLVLVDDTRMATMNKDYLHRNGPTNVIAFSMREGPFEDISPELLGDVVISLDTTAREAQNADLSLSTRFCHLLVHGILHLVGYDHEDDEREAEIMEKKSREVLQAIQKSDGSMYSLSQMITKTQSALH